MVNAPSTASRVPEDDTARPAKGVRVVDIGRNYASIPAMVLADFGADVIRVVPSPDDGLASSADRQWNRGKHLLSADLRKPDERAAVHDLLRGADVLVENFRPARASALGLDHVTVAALNPALVHLSITGFGPSGRLAETKGYEGVVAALAGQHIIQNGYRSAGPIYDAVPKAAFGAAMLGLIGVLAALSARDRFGGGQHVQTSLVQALSVYSYGGLRAEDAETTERLSLVQGRDPHNNTPGYRIARCADGRWIQSGSYGPGIFENLMRALGIDEYFTDRRYANGVWTLPPEDRDRLIAMIDEAYLRRPLAEWIRRFEEFDAAYGVFLTTQQYLEYPQNVHNGAVVEVDDPEVGRMKQIGPIASFAGSPWPWPGAPRPARPLGEVTWSSGRMQGRLGTPAASLTSEARGGPLAGTTILDLAMWAAAPGGPGLLADLGAEVIKVEPPDGDPTSRTGGELFIRMTRSKRRVAIDLKQPSGQAILHRLVARADAVVHNFRPGVPDRLGCDFATLVQHNPRLVYVHAAAFGSAGPDARRPAFDPVISAMAGGEIRQAGEGNPPQQRQTADHSALLGVAVALLLGLRNRDLTGASQQVETTMLTSAAYLFSDDFLWWDGMPESPLPDHGQHGLGALYRLYPTSDGWVFLACAEEDEWRRFAAAADPGLLDDSRFADAHSRQQHDSALSARIAARLACAPTHHWVDLLGAVDVACVVADRSWAHLLFDDPDALAPGMVPTTNVPGIGRIRQLGSTIDFTATPATLGELEPFAASTVTVLQRVGIPREEIDALAEAGVIRVT